MLTDSTDSQAAVNGSGENNRTPCPVYGCKRVYTDMTSLDNHIKDHEKPAQSLPEKAYDMTWTDGLLNKLSKILLCSSPGCSGSFPSMQKLMEHVRHHYKPNIFFLCESCRTKLRSYRGLLTHLHTCSKVPGGKTKSAEPVPPLTPAGTNPNINPMVPDQRPPQLDSVSQSQESPFQKSNPDTFFPAAAPQTDSATPPLLAPPVFSKQETLPALLTAEQHAEEDAQFQIKSTVSDPSRSPAGPAPALDPSYTQDQHKTTRTPASAPHSPQGPTAVWKKTQGMACNRRILWEHTKGRYTCVQCGFIGSSRKEMTQHINSQHSSNRAAEDTGSGASNT